MKRPNLYGHGGPFKEFDALMNNAEKIAGKLDDNYITTEHLLMPFLKIRGRRAAS